MSICRAASSMPEPRLVPLGRGSYTSTCLQERQLNIFSAPLVDNARAQRWEQGLSASEQARAQRFIDPIHRRRFVLRRWILRCLLGSRLDAVPESLTFRINAFGRPMLAAPFDRAGLVFSASHSGDLALIALRIGRPMFAVDVECARVLDDADQLVARLFSPAEREEYRGLDPADRQEAFWRGWTVKEAFIKALGFGLSFPLDQFDVVLRPDRGAAIAQVRGLDAAPWDVCIVDVGRDYRGALVGQDLHGVARTLVPQNLDFASLPEPRSPQPEP